MLVSVLETLPRSIFLDEAQGTVYVARAMVVFENIEPEPVSAKVAERLVNDRSQDLPTEAKSWLGNHDPLQFKRTVRGSQAAHDDVTGQILSLFHSVVGIVRVVHLPLVRTNVVAVNKTEIAEPLLDFNKKTQVVRSCAAEIHWLDQILAGSSCNG